MIQKFYSTLNEFLINGVIYTTFMCNYDSHVQDISFESGSSYQRYWRNEIVKFVIVRSWEDEKGGGKYWILAILQPMFPSNLVWML